MLALLTLCLQQPAFDNGVATGTVQSTAITEASGIAASRRTPGALWVHNDSGDSNRVFALNPQGELLGTYTLSGASAADWEDVAVGPGPAAGTHYLYVADIGNNSGSRTTLTIYRVPEPSISLGQRNVVQTLSGVAALRVRYPDGSFDGETLLCDPDTRDLYLVTKRGDGASGVYRYAYPQDAAATTTLTRVATVQFGTSGQDASFKTTTGGDISSSGREILVCTYQQAFLWSRAPGQSVDSAFAGARVQVPYVTGGEAIGFSAPADGYYTIKEGLNQKLWFYRRQSQPDTTAPAVTITGPTSSATHATSTTPLALSGTASDNVGVTQVNWSNAAGGNGTATGTTNWSASAVLVPGSNVITVTARDAAGNTAIDTLTVTYTPPANSAPTCSISSPAGGATFTAPASITINAGASDPDGSVSKVEFFNGAVKLGEDFSTPYSFSWTSVAAGTYSLTARATDNLGATGASGVVTVTVNPPPNSPPSCSITSPAGGATFTAPASITIAASASDPGGSVTKVEFFNGATKLGEDLSTPYSFSWTSVAAGTYSLTARATDNLGATGTSAAVAVTVNSPANTPPACSVTSPAGGMVFTAPASIAISVNASDPGGTVSKVEFFAGATKLGEDLSAPYSFGWTNVASGAYTLTARATDDLGATGTSAPVSIVVDPGDARDNDGDGIRNDLDPDDDDDGIADGADPDRDGDGTSNGDESIAGTDPDDRTSFPVPAGGGGGDGGSSCGATGLEALGLLLLRRRR